MNGDGECGWQQSTGGLPGQVHLLGMCMIQVNSRNSYAIMITLQIGIILRSSVQGWGVLSLW